jgi:hypothetical protein
MITQLGFCLDLPQLYSVSEAMVARCKEGGLMDKHKLKFVVRIFHRI